ncbi:MAG: alpha/beta fold hydrolase [Nitrososphaerota archaeon]|jgi:3-oxoadipate enol-lactonase|nr:alpha/beta fold hydrolase [Nitrososphaerota archaeon]MDG6923660.1 alpha/beta fold hydrolase [Nitrososphaerota archaeon]
MEALINGTKIHFGDVGSSQDPPIVLIHGFPLSSDMWKPQIEFLKNRYRVIFYDVRGHGKSEVGDGQYTIELFVDDLIAFLDHLKIMKAALCGLSMGGYIALRVIERNPERVSSLILCDTGPQTDSNEVKLRRASNMKAIKADGVEIFAEGFLKAVFRSESFIARPTEVAAIQQMIVANSEIGICGTLLALACRTDTTDSLDKIKVPTLILVGEDDKVCPPRLSELMNSKILNSEIHIIPKAGHISNLENTEEFNRQLSNFLLANKV